MAHKLDKIVIVDIETTCLNDSGYHPEQTKQKPFLREVIEVGICLVNLTTLEIEDLQQIFVRPMESKITEFCTELTGITNATIQKSGIAFEDTCNIIKRSPYKTTKRAWLSCGDFDRNQFYNQCQREDIFYPFGPTHINLKPLFAIANSLNKETGMMGMLKKYNIPLEGRHHCGVDDVKNIGKIFIHLIKKLRMYS